MTLTQESQLDATVTRFIRSASVLDAVRLQAWEGMGVTFPQLRILFNVRNLPGIDLRGLAQRLDISPSAVSQQVEKLVSRGLLKRTDNPEDRRRVSLELTEDGARATLEISRAAHERVASLLSRLDERDVAELDRILCLLLDEPAAATP